jgi:hypothetical protein
MFKNYLRFDPSLYWEGSHKTVLSVLAVLTLFCLNHLAQGNMASNEANYLVVAKQYVNPSWIPKDWYLNQPIGHQALLQLFWQISGGLGISHSSC